MKNRMMRPALVAMIVALVALGCGGSQQREDLVDRETVAMAFEMVDEPLAIVLDMAEADPGSVVDVIFVPARDDVPDPPFEVTVFEGIDHAEVHSRILEAVSPAGTDIRRTKNVVLTISSPLEDNRRARVVTAFGRL